jgi:putative toxin-antitoxin system antitoxin component (TIGR02293 family)
MRKSDTAIKRHVNHSSAEALLGLDQTNSQDIISSIICGLPFQSLGALSSNSDLPIEGLSRAIGLHPAKFTRRKAQGKLTPAESDHLVSIANTIACVSNFFSGNKEVAARWFMTPSPALGDITPLQMGKTHTGCRAVETLIGRLAHGALS